MDIPDFIGMEYNKVIEFIKQNYPHINIKKTMYIPVMRKKEFELDSSKSERIIRQKVLPDGKIEFVVSVFDKYPLQ